MALERASDIKDYSLIEKAGGIHAWRSDALKKSPNPGGTINRTVVASLTAAGHLEWSGEYSVIKICILYIFCVVF